MTFPTGGRRTAFGALLFALIAGCSPLHARTAESPEQVWPPTLTSAQASATEGKFDTADSILAGFATRYPGSPQSVETTYWRAICRLDPTNPHASLTSAMALLDGYLADPRPRQHVGEATTIRRLAGQLDGLNHVAANAMAQASSATATAKDAKAQAADAAAKAAEAPPPSGDAEIKRLKDELAKANAELDRIRKRLAQPPPKQP